VLISAPNTTYYYWDYYTISIISELSFCNSRFTPETAITAGGALKYGSRLSGKGRRGAMIVADGFVEQVRSMWRWHVGYYSGSPRG